MQGPANLFSGPLLAETLGGSVENTPRCGTDHGVEVAIVLLDLGQIGVDELDTGDGTPCQQLLQKSGINGEQINGFITFPTAHASFSESQFILSTGSSCIQDGSVLLPSEEFKFYLKLPLILSQIFHSISAPVLFDHGKCIPLRLGAEGASMVQAREHVKQSAAAAGCPQLAPHHFIAPTCADSNAPRPQRELDRAKLSNSNVAASRLQPISPSAATTQLISHGTKTTPRNHIKIKNNPRWRNKANLTCKCRRCSTGCTRWRLLRSKSTPRCNIKLINSTNHSTNNIHSHSHKSRNSRSKASPNRSSAPTSRWPCCPHPRTVSTTRGTT